MEEYEADGEEDIGDGDFFFLCIEHILMSCESSYGFAALIFHKQSCHTHYILSQFYHGIFGVVYIFFTSK